MSTKSSLSYGKKFHFYEEVFEEDAVYLELSGSAAAGASISLEDGVVVMVRIPKEIMNQIVMSYVDANTTAVKIKQSPKRKKSPKSI